LRLKYRFWYSQVAISQSFTPQVPRKLYFKQVENFQTVEKGIKSVQETVLLQNKEEKVKKETFLNGVIGRAIYSISKKIILKGGIQIIRDNQRGSS